MNHDAWLWARIDAHYDPGGQDDPYWEDAEEDDDTRADWEYEKWRDDQE